MLLFEHNEQMERSMLSSLLVRREEPEALQLAVLVERDESLPDISDVSDTPVEPQNGKGKSAT
jgi:hypothetical protein